MQSRLIGSQDYRERTELIDYKFFCFNGKARFLYISKGLENHSTAKISFYSFDGTELPFYRSDYAPFHDAILPGNTPKMEEIANKLAESIKSPFVRIDMYSIENRIFFSEITFTPCSGLLPFRPKSADMELGRLIELPQS